jgi:hypothetical protein
MGRCQHWCLMQCDYEVGLSLRAKFLCQHQQRANFVPILHSFQEHVLLVVALSPGYPIVLCVRLSDAQGCCCSVYTLRYFNIAEQAEEDEAEEE